MERVLSDQEEFGDIFDCGALRCNVGREIALFVVRVQTAVGGLCGGGGRCKFSGVRDGGEDLEEGGFGDDDVLRVAGGEGEGEGVGYAGGRGELGVDFGHGWRTWGEVGRCGGLMVVMVGVNAVYLRMLCRIKRVCVEGLVDTEVWGGEVLVMREPSKLASACC